MKLIKKSWSIGYTWENHRETVYGETSGKAKYKLFFRHSDCFDQSFKEFLKQIICRRSKEDDLYLGIPAKELEGLSKQSIHILKHSLGLEENRPEPNRNHYCSNDTPDIKELRERKLMSEPVSNGIFISPMQRVTELGKVVINTIMPRPKLLFNLETGYLIEYENLKNSV